VKYSLLLLKSLHKSPDTITHPDNHIKMRFYQQVVPGSVFLHIILCSNFGLFASAFGWNSYRSLALDTKRKSASLHLHKGNAKEESYPSVPLKSTSSRRSFIDNALGSISVVAITSFSKISPAIAEEETGKTLRSNLYLILRVKEATFQETRLISSGKFKDVQRANVKLAVKFMVSNYRLADNFVAASSYLEGNRRIEAGNIGQSAVESLYTILEYFDSSDVQNIKVRNAK